MDKPKPTPGRNSFGRTPSEQADYDKLNGPKPKETNPLMDFIKSQAKKGMKPVKLKTTKASTVKSSPMNMSMSPKAAAVAKKVASKKKFDIPASPTK